SVYEDVKHESGVIDFEDVLLLMIGMLAEHEEVATQVRSQYRHFVVDEYQDVSPLQQQLLDLWLGERKELCVVGDVSQTIYSFTGATPNYLTNFNRAFPGAEVITLNRDYRSTPQVVHLANEILARAGRERGAAPSNSSPNASVGRRSSSPSMTTTMPKLAASPPASGNSSREGWKRRTSRC